MKTRSIFGQDSWTFGTKTVEAAVTQQGGNLGPIRFRLGKRWIQPMDIAPWAEETLPSKTPSILRTLRGDFFCMPFGGNTVKYRGEAHPPHGETVNSKWKLASSTSEHLHLTLQTKVRKGRVDKVISLVEGHTAVYSRHIISGIQGAMSWGHHAILQLESEGAGRVSVSPFRLGRVCPQPFENPAQGGYSILQHGAEFQSLKRVPRIDGKMADLSVYPSRAGYEDLVLMATDPKEPFGWTAVVVAEKKYVWFSLKDPSVLPSTVFWMSNGGRHYAPWNGRHRHAIGLEEVMSYFHYGLAESAKSNELSRAGIPTSQQLDPKHPTSVNYIMAVAEIPDGFDIVKTIVASDDGESVTLTSQSGKSVSTPLDVSFLFA